MLSQRVICALVVVLVCGVSATAMPIEVGTGENTAGLYIEWKDGFSVEFAVSFAGESMTGFDLIQLVAQETVLDTVVQNYGFGDFIDGISYEGHSNVGFVPEDDWWHYWIKDPGQEWISPWEFGASGRIVTDGVWDGWVYGRDTIPEPASVLLFGLGGLLLRRKERKSI